MRSAIPRISFLVCFRLGNRGGTLVGRRKDFGDIYKIK
jgi:hypothetical protein